MTFRSDLYLTFGDLSRKVYTSKLKCEEGLRRKECFQNLYSMLAGGLERSSIKLHENSERKTVCFLCCWNFFCKRPKKAATKQKYLSKNVCDLSRYQ